MKNRLKDPKDPIGELLLSQEDEIQKYKWIESEKTGLDIGYDRASSEWFDRHFPNWHKNKREQTVQEALMAWN